MILNLGRPPARPVSINETRGKHWASARRDLDPWRDLVATLARPLGRRITSTTGHRHITVELTIPFPRGGRRDPHNYTGTVVKACVDGLVAAGVVPDDTPRWVTVLDPALVVGQHARLTITPTKGPTHAP